MRNFKIVAMLVLAGTFSAAAGEIGFTEDFALTEDRAKALKQLIPGTEEYYFFHCLHHQNTGELGKVSDLLKLWRQRYGDTARVIEIENRQALLLYEKEPRKSLEFIRGRLGVQFNHFKEELEQKPNLPTKLDPKRIARGTLKDIALSQQGGLSGFNDSALEWLLADGLNADLRRIALQRLRHPDYPKLAELIVDDLKHQYSGGFGSLEIHKLLLLEQMNEILKRMPELLQNSNFVQQYIRKLQPNPDVDWQHDVKEKLAYLERLLNFTRTLAPAFNSLKAHVLYHRLLTDRAAGIYDKDRFMEYLKLPRQIHYVKRDYLNREEFRSKHAQLHEDYRSFTAFAPVQNDEALVRDFLIHFFTTEDDLKPYELYIEDVYLKELFAEAKILAGVGDQEKWYSLLNNPAKYQALKDRIDLEFAPENKTYFKAGEAVSIALDVKNVQTLLVKVFELNTSNYYREQLREVDTTINLDGLVANEEKTYTYPEPPQRRIRRTFEFPLLKNPGVYVVDFIGNGKSSRAVIRKGQLRFIERTGAAGHALTVLDENNVKQPNATIWMGGREFAADKNGEIHIPYSTQPQRTALVMSSDGFHDLEFFQHQGEAFTLTAGIYVDREALIKRRKATLLVRPALNINDVRVSLKLLEEPRLTLATVDRDGIRTTKVLPDLKLTPGEEYVTEIQVPENLLELQVVLDVKVQSVTLNKKLDLSVTDHFTLNHIDRTEAVDAPFLSRTAAGYVLSLLGKSGEPRPEKAVNLRIEHRDFTRPVDVSLQTDENGRIELGALPEIRTLQATRHDGEAIVWHLRGDEHNLPLTVNGKTGTTLYVPYLGTTAIPQRTELSLLERRGETYVKDWFERLAIKDGFIEIKELPVGDYELKFKETGETVAIHITGGEQQGGFILSESRLLQVKNAAPLNIAALQADDAQIKIQLKNANDLTRVHVFANRFMPGYSAFQRLNRIAEHDPATISLVKDETVYVSGRDIGDEFQYIFDRKYAVKYPGNMLKRPGLLLNPWAMRTTETGLDVGTGHGSFGSRTGGGRRSIVKRHGGVAGTTASNANSLNLDFLPRSALALTNLRPGKDGAVTIARKDVEGFQHIVVVAIDPQNTAVRNLALPETKLAPADQRLIKGLDPLRHFTEQKQVAVVEKGAAFTLQDIGTSSVEVYDSLDKVFRLFKTLNGDAKLDEFSFVLNWPKLKPEEKREKYSKYACHELHFFLSQKDPEFFKEVVAPYLQNKKDKTFMDHWLLNADLARYLQPWNYQRLNVVERVLLARSLDAEREPAARHVRDLYELIPPDLEHNNFLFKTALKGSALDANDDLGLRAGAAGLKNGVEAEPAVGAADPAKPGESRVAEELAKRADSKAKKFAPPPAAAPLADAPAAKSEKADKDGNERQKAKAQEGERGAAGFDEAPQNEALAERDLDVRAQLRALYQKLDKTEEWAENNYYKLPIEVQLADLVPVNGFWKDYSALKPGAPFLSTHVAEPARNFTEMICALAVLDLPFEAPKHVTEIRDARMTLTAGGPVLIFHKQILESAPGEKTPILVSQNFFRFDDRYRFDGNERYDKYVTDEFLTHVVYGCQVVLTNPTSSPLKLELLTQIPVGAVPVKNGYYTRGQYLLLQPYATASYEFHFYFPAAGEAAHYPVHVSKNEKLVASAEPVKLKVVARLTKLDTASWQYVSQHGTQDEVLKFLRENNINRLDLSKLAWRMREPEFFKVAIELLARRHIYNHTLWSYALLHDDTAAAREFLQFCDAFIQQCGAYIDTKLVTIDPVSRYAYQHLEYSPLVNARVHKFGNDQKILNTRFFEQYMRQLNVLCYRPALDHVDLLGVTYYLMLQDRIAEAQAFFQKVQPGKVASRLQYDYMRAYLDFYTADRKEARGIAVAYNNHPVVRWRNLFQEVLNQLDEIEGKSLNIVDKEDRTQKQTKLAATEPSFEFKVEARKVSVRYQNLADIQVKYYLMDVELLFSGNPFVQQHGGQFAYIRPNRQETHKLPENQVEFAFDLPEEFRSANVMVEITGAGKRKTQAYYANSLTLQMVENYGQVRVTHQTTNAPLPKVYVKVYARMKDGTTQFYKDGYTDLRGRFDYTALSTNELDNVDKFALLVMSDANGAVVREAAPPKQ